MAVRGRFGDRTGWGPYVRALYGAAIIAGTLFGAHLPAGGQETDRKGLAMREEIYEKLSRAQEAAEAENWSEALEELDDVKRMKDLNAYEAAQLYSAYGYTYFGRGMYGESIQAYETVLLQENLPEALETTTLYTLAQLQFQVEDYEKTITYLDRWLAIAENPGPDPLVLLAQAYYQQERYREAVDPVVRAIAEAEERGRPAQESWYVLLRSLYYELGEKTKLLEVLETLVTKFPKKTYWVHLAAMYGEMGDTRRQLAVYEIAFAQGFLDTGRELLLLSQLLLQAEVPYRAGALLEEGLTRGSIESTEANWRLLSQAWVLAREPGKAVEALTRAASLSDDGELDARLAQSYADLDDWENTVTAAQDALRKGVRAPDDLRILMGIALFELQRYEEAKAAFQKAQASGDTRAAASRWIAHIEQEEERLRELQGSLR